MSKCYKWPIDFKIASYEQWAIDEIVKYITRQMYPRTSGTIDEFYNLITQFIGKITTYVNLNTRSVLVFQTVNNVAINVLDLLCAMK